MPLGLETSMTAGEPKHDDSPLPDSPTRESPTTDEERTDESIDESFPASDPPAVHPTHRT